MPPEKILIVDDEPTNLMTLVEMIEDSFPQMEVVQALNGKMAIYVAKATAPSLIVTDWDMPSMDGIELIKHLKADPETREIPVIMCTGSMLSHKDLSYALDAGAADYVRKPVDPVELSARIKSMLALVARNREVIAEKERHAATMIQLEKEQAQRAIREAMDEKRAAEQNRELKEQFFAQVTHELRTPLTLILGPLQDILSDTLEHQTRSKADLAVRNSKILLRHINHLLDLAKADSDWIKPEAQPIDLSAFVGEVLTNFSALASQKALEMDFQADSNLGMVSIDPSLLRQVLDNLLSNAIKFTPQQGKITVTASISESQFRIQVRDTGIGISEDQLPFIFDAFYQVSGGNPHAHKGTGLGLPVSRQLVEAMNGELSVQSIVGQGTQFTLALPRTPESTFVAASKTITTELSLENQIAWPRNDLEDDEYSDLDQTILLVEDNPDIRSYLRMSLGKDWKIVEAADGQHGLRRAEKIIPDLIISDVMMPGQDGFQVCQALKENITTSHIPVVLLTAKAGLPAKLQGLETGADAYLTKPFNREELNATVQNLLEGRKRLQSHFQAQGFRKLQPGEERSQEDVFLEKVFSLVEEHLGNSGYGVETLAEGMALSRTQLHRKLKSLTGKAPGVLIRNYRMNAALRMIENDLAPIGEIGYKVGYPDPAQFSKTFSACHGISPSEAKKKAT